MADRCGGSCRECSLRFLPPRFLGTFSTDVWSLSFHSGYVYSTETSRLEDLLHPNLLNSVSDRRTDGILCSKLS